MLRKRAVKTKQAVAAEEQQAKDQRKEEWAAKRQKKDDDEREKNDKIAKIVAAIELALNVPDPSGHTNFGIVKIQKLRRLRRALALGGEDFKVTRATHPRIRDAKDEIARLEELEKKDDPDDKAMSAQAKHDRSVSKFCSQWRAMFDDMAETGEVPTDEDILEMVESMSRKF